MGLIYLRLNGTLVVNGTAAPASVTPAMVTRFSSTLYNIGAAFELLAFEAA
jgi:hypothetical protein